MNEFGETPVIYVWPLDHAEGEPFPDNFWQKVGEGLRSVGIDYETA